MKTDIIAEIKQELKRFEVRLREYEEKMKKEKCDSFSFPCKEMVSLKRSSLDLSNVLIKLRNPWKYLWKV